MVDSPAETLDYLLRTRMDRIVLGDITVTRFAPGGSLPRVVRQEIES
jgi:hypothetical protein